MLHSKKPSLGECRMFRNIHGTNVYMVIRLVIMPCHLWHSEWYSFSPERCHALLVPQGIYKMWTQPWLDIEKAIVFMHTYIFFVVKKKLLGNTYTTHII